VAYALHGEGQAVNQQQTEPAIDTDLLEPLLRRLAQEVGLEATMKIVARHGGRQVYIGEQGGVLIDLIGPEAAEKVGRLIGPYAYLIPKALPALRHLRDQRMLAARAAKGVRTIAGEHGLGERQAWKIMKRGASRRPAQPGDVPAYPDDDRNGRLF
jgi:hypothetical protein